MYERAKRYTLVRPRLKKIAGGVLVTVGFVALITPFTPGAFIMIPVGMELLGFKILFIDRLLKREKPSAQE